MQGLARFHSPTEILFGFGAAEKLTVELTRLGVRHPLVLTDRPADEPAHRRLVNPLVAAGMEVSWDAGIGAGGDELADCGGADRYRRDGCDAIIAVGGGRVLDSAKVAAVFAAANPPDRRLPASDFDCMAGGKERIEGLPPLPPVIALPTTAGTGSEVSPAAMVQTFALPGGTPRKIMFLSRRLIPRLAICDPGLALSCPPWLVAGAGMDALSHAVEVFLSPRPHPAVDAVALEVVRRIARDLPESYIAAEVGGDTPERRRLTAEMMMSALMAGMGFEKGVGLVHCLSHPLSAMFGVHHGTANAMLLPAALRFQAAAVPEKMAALGAAFASAGLAAEPAAAVAELNRRLGIPAGLAAMEVKPDGLAAAAKQAFADPCRLTTPVRFRPADVERLYRESM